MSETSLTGRDRVASPKANKGGAVLKKEMTAGELSPKQSAELILTFQVFTQSLHFADFFPKLSPQKHISLCITHSCNIWNLLFPFEVIRVSPGPQLECKRHEDRH